MAKIELSADAVPKNKSENLTRTAGRGALWNAMGGAGQTIIRLGASTILARVLTPDDFGLFGLALLARELIQLLGAMGMGVGVIVKKDVTEDDLCTCFWSLAAIRFVLFVLAFLLAPLAAIFFKNPDVTIVLRAVSFTFLFSIISGVSAPLLQKKLQFGRLVIINLFCALVESATAVSLAVLTDYRYWALVVGLLVSSLVLHVSVLIAAGWLPRFRFSRKSFHYLFRFGINTLGFSFVNYLHQNIDYLLVGRFLGTASLGFYQFAYQIPHMIRDRLARPVGSVVFPALSTVQDSDERLIAGYVKASKYIGLGAFPALGGLAVLAHSIVVVLWGAKWLPIVVPMQILCLCAALRCVMTPIGSIFLCKDRPDILFKFGLVRLAFTFSVVGIFTYLYDLNGVAIGMLVSTIPAIYILSLAFKMTESSPLKFLLALWEPTLATCVSMLCAFCTSYGLHLIELHQWIILCGSVLAGIAGYIICLRVLFHSLMQEILSTINVIIRT